jgi:hypothetical protein
MSYIKTVYFNSFSWNLENFITRFSSKNKFYYSFKPNVNINRNEIILPLIFINLRSVIKFLYTQ